MRLSITLDMRRWRTECLHLEDGPVEEECQQLQKVVEDVAVFLLHPQDVGRVEGLGALQLQLLVEWKKAKLEEVLDNNGDLEHREGEENNMRIS